jgi:DNA-binding GntR family transcriptional regulator
MTTSPARKKLAVAMPRMSQASALPLPEEGAISLKDAAYRAIKHKIITCAFKPGEFINEMHVSALLGIGRTPVHQAIDRLMLEGMVSIRPRKGIFVNAVSFEEIMEIVEVRLLNETYCARRAAELADSSNIAHLTDILARAEQWLPARNIEQLMLLDSKFHTALSRAARNDVLSDVIIKLNDRSLRFWFLSLVQPGQNEAVQRQHQHILDAIKNRNPDEAEAAMRNHIEDFRRNLMQQSMPAR